MKPYKKPSRTYDLQWIKSNCVVSKKTGCWEWTLAVQNAGYGIFGIALGSKNKTHTVHRYVYQIVNNVILPTNRVVRHLCHNSLCCNPDHLAEGSYKDNWYDSESTHRATHKRIASKKKRALNATLTDGQVTRYRRLYLKGVMSLIEISRETGLAKPTVNSFIIGKTYKRHFRFVNAIRKKRGLPLL